VKRTERSRANRIAQVTLDFYRELLDRPKYA
jgi:hypothetical protein